MDCLYLKHPILDYNIDVKYEMKNHLFGSLPAIAYQVNHACGSVQTEAIIIKTQLTLSIIVYQWGTYSISMAEYQYVRVLSPYSEVQITLNITENAQRHICHQS